MLNSNKIKAVIFDLDDTLIQSFEYYGRTYDQVAKEYGIKITDNDKRRWWGKPTDEVTLGILQNIDTLENLKSRKSELNKDMVIPAFPDAINLLNGLHKNHKLGIVSSGYSQLVTESLQKAGFDLDMFEIILGYDTSKFYKPDPRVFNPVLELMAEKYGINIEEMLFIGDSVYDYQATVDTPMQFRGVLTGPATLGKFLDAGAEKEMIMEGLSGLRELIL